MFESNSKRFSDCAEDAFPESCDGVGFSACDLLLDDGSGALEIVVEEGVFTPEVCDKGFGSSRQVIQLRAEGDDEVGVDPSAQGGFFDFLDLDAALGGEDELGWAIDDQVTELKIDPGVEFAEDPFGADAWRMICGMADCDEKIGTENEGYALGDVDDGDFFGGR